MTLTFRFFQQRNQRSNLISKKDYLFGFRLANKQTSQKIIREQFPQLGLHARELLPSAGALQPLHDVKGRAKQHLQDLSLIHI